MISDLQNALTHDFGANRILHEEPLAKHCNWRAGGPADLLVIVRTTDELVKAVARAKSYSVPFTLIGFGANVLVSDRGIRGLVILNRAHRIEFLSDSIVETDSGTNLAVLAKACAQHGVGGLEFLIGIPGTVGAAVAVNAGTRTEWISTIVSSVKVLPRRGELAWLEPAELAFSYRSSRLKHTDEVVITARLLGKPDDLKYIVEKMAQHLQVRKNQPTGPSAGSVFKNPEGDFAGRLIEAGGLKGFKVGGAEVSNMHANFILNTGTATATDIKNVIAHVKREVKKVFGVALEEEIRYLGEW